MIDSARRAEQWRGRDRLGVKTKTHRRRAISGRHSNQIRAAFCERCGRIGDMQLHHRDYNRPNVTMWLCVHCHPIQQAVDRAAGYDCYLTDY